MKSLICTLNVWAFILLCTCSCRYEQDSKQRLLDLIGSSKAYTNIELTRFVVYEPTPDVGRKEWMLSGSLENMDDYITLREDLAKNKLFDVVMFAVDVKALQPDKPLFIQPHSIEIENDAQMGHRYSANVPFGESTYFDFDSGITWSGVSDRERNLKDIAFKVSKSAKDQSVTVSAEFSSERIKRLGPPVWRKEEDQKWHSSDSFTIKDDRTFYFRLKFQIIGDENEYILRGQCRLIPNHLIINAIHERWGIGVIH